MNVSVKLNSMEEMVIKGAFVVGLIHRLMVVEGHQEAMKIMEMMEMENTVQ